MSDEYTDEIQRVYRFALRLAGDPHRAEDLTGETMLRAWRKQATLRDERARKTWLFRIAVNLWRDGLRQRERNPTCTIQMETAGNDAAPDVVLENHEQLRRAISWLDELPPRQREVLHLVAVEQLSIADVSDVLNIDRSAVKSQLSLARKKMRDKLRIREE